MEFVYDPESGFVKHGDEWLTTTDEIHTAMSAELIALRARNAELLAMLTHPEGICGRCGCLNVSDHMDWCDYGKKIAALIAKAEEG